MRYRTRANHAATLSMIVPALLLWVTCLACSQTDEAGAVRELIEKGARLAEKHDIGEILDLATRDVRAMPGNLERREIKGVLWQAFKYYGPLRVLYPHPFVSVKAESNQASAQFPFLIVKKDSDYPELEELARDPMAWVEAVGDRADLYRLKLELTNEDGDWSVYRAHLERFTGAGFMEE